MIRSYWQRPPLINSPVFTKLSTLPLHDFHHRFPGCGDESQSTVPNPAAEMEPDFVGETLVERSEGEKGEQESRGVILGEGIYGAEVNSHETSREPFQMWLLMKGR